MAGMDVSDDEFDLLLGGTDVPVVVDFAEPGSTLVVGASSMVNLLR